MTFREFKTFELSLIRKRSRRNLSKSSFVMKEQEQKRRTKAQTRSELKRLTKKFSKLKNDDNIMKNNELSEKKQKKQKKKFRTNDVFLSFLANYLVNNCKFFVRCRNIDLLNFIVFTIICSEHYVEVQVLFKCRTHFVRLRMLMLMLYTVRTIKRC